ncbi:MULTISPECIES: hypothetical protein [unclassified Leptolyngbya]|uniref:hypothetical protein n=1 Tax=unclassified Leptolyngbya TaxID=2650499 RepID=UPI001682F1BB|nr:MULTISPECIES: hypothetical protein [unclassified Leptolyngbya]MBD1912048.1 hypothetical protein [Leptolyngbya sp. FACHB-8]MBD2155418.1 hypothetical protein [Leptolyngbya sp. FACHB-16]
MPLGKQCDRQMSSLQFSEKLASIGEVGGKLGRAEPMAFATRTEHDGRTGVPSTLP